MYNVLLQVLRSTTREEYQMLTMCQLPICTKCIAWLYFWGEKQLHRYLILLANNKVKNTTFSSSNSYKWLYQVDSSSTMFSFPPWLLVFPCPAFLQCQSICLLFIFQGGPKLESLCVERPSRVRLAIRLQFLSHPGFESIWIWGELAVLAKLSYASNWPSRRSFNSC